MEDKLKEFHARKNKILAKLDHVSKKIIQINTLVSDLPGATSLHPYSLPFDNASLCIKKNKDTAKRITSIYYRSDSVVEERPLIETSTEVRIYVEPYLEEFIEYIFSEIEDNFRVDAQNQVIDRPLSCHTPDIDSHNQWCIDASDCRYGQPDGPEDYINECDCYFEQE